jgi:hypothetical protein
MRKELHFIVLMFILLISRHSGSLNGQSIIFTEDFSGFTTGTHSTPSTSDASASLDTKTLAPGWSGSLVYSAGGEIKIGTSTSTGWVETPLIDLTGSGGSFIIRFDIARWVSDATTVQVCFNDSDRGGVITPTDNFQTVQIQCTEQSASGKIKIKGLTKRFYLDNFNIIKGGVSTGSDEAVIPPGLRIYPVPASSELKIEDISGYNSVEIIDLTGRIILSIDPGEESMTSIDISALNNGIYLLRFSKGKISRVMRFVKSGM